MAISVKAAKAKARRLQDYIRDLVREVFDLSEHDVKSAVMGENEMDVKLSAEAREKFPYAVEAKAYQRFAIYKHWDQTTENAKKEDLTPLLVIRGDRRKALAILDLEDFFRIIKP